MNHLLSAVIVVLTAAAAWAWAVAHQLFLGWIGAVLVEQLPPPDANSGKFYAYFYSVLQVFAANLKRSKDAVKAVNPPKP